MKNYKLLRLSGFLLLVIFMIGLPLFLGNTKPTAKISPKPIVGQEGKERLEHLRNLTLKVQTKTPALKVVNLEKDVDNEVIKITLKNKSDKVITAYDIQVGIGTVISDLITEELSENNLLYPGGECIETYELQTGIETKGISVLAVLFQDKTSDGDPVYIKDMQDYRLGVKMGIAESLNFFKEIQQLPKASIPEAFINHQQSKSLMQNGQELPHFVKVGLQDTRGRIEHNIARFQRGFQKGPNIGSEIINHFIPTYVQLLEKTILKL